MFIVIEIQKNADNTFGSIVTEHATENEAASKYHSILASAAVSNIPVHSAIMVSEEGFPIANKCYKH